MSALCFGGKEMDVLAVLYFAKIWRLHVRRIGVCGYEYIHGCPRKIWMGYFISTASLCGRVASNGHYLNGADYNQLSFPSIRDSTNRVVRVSACLTEVKLSVFTSVGWQVTRVIPHDR